MVDQDIWTILQTYSFVQGFLIGLYAFLVLKRTYLGVLLFSISLLLLAHSFYHFDWFYSYPHLIFSEAPIWYLIGPLFYFFTLRLFNKDIKVFQLLHFLPFIAFTMFIFPFYFESGSEKLRILNSIFGKETYQADINRYIFTTHIFIYIVISYLTFNKESKRLRQLSSKSTLILDGIVLYALKYYLIFSFLGLVSYLVVGDNYEWTSLYYEFYYVGLSFLIHFIFYYSLFRSGSESRDKEGTSAVENASRKYHSSSLSSNELDEIIAEVTNYISQFEVYRNPELRLRMVSDELDIPAHHISQAINQNLGKTFFDLVNGYRIKGLQENINDERFKNYTLVGIASEYGFKSPSSFYRIFKKYTGKTPKEFFSGIDEVDS